MIFDCSNYGPGTGMKPPKPFVAICPDCDQHQNLEHMPAGWWPHCQDCTTAMNVYVRQTKRRMARSVISAPNQ